MTLTEMLVDPVVFFPLAIIWTALLVILTIDAVWKRLPRLKSLGEQLGLEKAPPGLVVIGLIFYVAIFLSLFIGLICLIWTTILTAWPSDEAEQGAAMFAILRVAAVTTVLAAVVAFPITVMRLRLATESLFNEKINAAAADLHAQRQVTRYDGGRAFDIWEGDIIRRSAAIDRLEGLAREYGDHYNAAERIARLLSVYVRELSRECPPKRPPETDDFNLLNAWVQELEPVRPEMQNAVQTLGRIRPLLNAGDIGSAINLSHTNLQAFDLRNTRLQGANFLGASLQGADLREARLQNTEFQDAGLQGADLQKTRFEAANLTSANLMSALLMEARLQAATLRWAKIHTDLAEARLQGADVRNAELEKANLWNAKLQNADFRGANLQRAHFGEAWLQGANLWGARMQGSHFSAARMQGVDLTSASLDDATNLKTANLRGAGVWMGNFSEVSQIGDHLIDIFGNGGSSITLPNGIDPPAHWPTKRLERVEWEKEWRAWQRSIGIDPNNIPDD